ncbi:thioesterase superfamily protein [Magnetococcus marinus MC-1]|uniref:Thioesterase superfamily protein n=1 Tax=Magnetococcus marinus (strain ATCC BAA-1437 / JCM 17883 / MC-1) TaxID=156889 RepID=A0L4V4_MAGMM|nr:tol-pal system-associated acyl-CoA thioesterase [Magnetococcus marinus]ABK42997.1 thioesterase superfamily protein [Magnetococcus marinus MC-1]
MNLFSQDIRVYYEDTDAGGVVYHSRYLNFMERCRTDWLRSLGIEQATLAEQTGLRFAVTHMEIAFQKPALLDDLLTVSVSELRRRPASLEFTQEIARQNTPLIRASARVACLDEGLRPVRLPAVLLQRLPQ